MSDYQSYDRWHTSPAERVRDQYKDAISVADADLQAIGRDIQMLREVVRVDVEKYKSGYAGDSSKGLFASDFEAAMDRWQDGVQALIGPYEAFTQALNDLDWWLSIMRSRKGTLDWMCWNEDNREREYLDCELPF